MKTLFLAAGLWALAPGVLCSFAAEEAVPGRGQAPDTVRIAAGIDALLTPDTVARLERGDVVTEKKGSHDAEGRARAQARAMILVNRPFAEVWGQMVRDEEYAEFFPYFLGSERYFVSGNEVGMRDRAKVIVFTVQYHVIQTRDPDHGVIAWRLDHSRPNDIRDTTGSWVFRPHGDGRCIAVYSADIDSGLHFPKAVERFFLNQGLPGMVKAVKRRVESAAACAEAQAPGGA